MMTTKTSPTELFKAPFSVYDFFGYLGPAVVFIVCIYLFESAARPFASAYPQPVLSLIERIVPKEPTSFIVQGGLAFICLLAAYVCGHVIASFGSFILDRTMVSKAHGYPLQRLLKLFPKPETERRLKTSQYFYRNVIFWGNFLLWLFLVLVMCDLTEFKYILGILAGAVALIPIYLCLVVYSERYESTKKLDALLYWITIILSGLYNLGWWFLNRFFRWDESFHPELIAQYRDAFRKAVGIDPVEAKTDNYWFSVFYVYSKSEFFKSMLTNWLHLYSFARNVASAFYLAFFYGAVYLIALKFFRADVGKKGLYCLFGTLAFYFALAVLMAVRFYYLYFTYYSKSLYRAFVFLSRHPSEGATVQTALTEE
jgi:hypothetical protein